MKYEPEHLGQSCLLADERDRRSAVQMEHAWLDYLLVLREQQDFEAYSEDRLIDILSPALSNLPNITAFFCAGLDQSRNVIAPLIGGHLRRSLRATLIRPEINFSWSPRERRFMTRYIMACLLPVLKSAARLTHLNLEVIPIEVLVELSDYMEYVKDLPGLASLQTLFLQLYSGIDEEEHFDSSGVPDAIATVLAAAPCLSTFKLWNWASHLHVEVDWDDLWLPGPPPFAHPWKLRCVNLLGIRFNREEARGLFKSMSSTLRSLTMFMMTLEESYWMDLFEDMRTILSLEEISFDHLIEFDVHHDSDATWFTSEVGSGTLKDKFTAYMLKVSDKNPWKTSDDEGTPQSWEELGDDSMWWEEDDADP